jgi:hypothetical protein
MSRNDNADALIRMRMHGHLGVRRYFQPNCIQARLAGIAMKHSRLGARGHGEGMGLHLISVDATRSYFSELSSASARQNPLAASMATKPVMLLKAGISRSIGASTGRRPQQYKSYLQLQSPLRVTDHPNFRFGSKCEELNLSKSGPPCLTERTSARCATSQMGQYGLGATWSCQRDVPSVPSVYSGSLRAIGRHEPQ